jgi:membrane-associated phospholipid phosphatase
MAINTKAETHLEFNRFHNSFFDVFFQYMTYLGEGYAVTLVFIMLLAIRFRYAVIVAVANFIASSITQILKHTIFSEVVRPKKFFEGLHDLYLVPNVDNHLYNSFPSGHTTCAFALYFSIALIIKNKKLKFLCFLAAFAVGYSRIYLSQHFLEDVYAGSLIGTIITMIVFLMIQKSNAGWLEKSLRNLRDSV